VASTTIYRKVWNVSGGRNDMPWLGRADEGDDELVDDDGF
jgi:hypothetical protein